MTMIHEFDPVIYPCRLWVIKNPTQKLVDENFNELNGSNLNFDINPHAVMSCYNKVVASKESGFFGIIISIWHKPNVKYIAHESTHAARFIWDWLEEGTTGVEADAYLVGWIADCIEKTVKNKAK